MCPSVFIEDLFLFLIKLSTSGTKKLVKLVLIDHSSTLHDERRNLASPGESPKCEMVKMLDIGNRKIKCRLSFHIMSTMRGTSDEIQLSYLCIIPLGSCKCVVMFKR